MINKREYKLKHLCEINGVDDNTLSIIQDCVSGKSICWVYWLIKLYGRGKWKVSDAYETKDSIDRLYFYHYQGLITDQDLSCNKYSCIGDIIKFLLVFDGNKEDSNIERDDISICDVNPRYVNDYSIFYYDKDWLVIIPLSFKGSEMWGYDTKWCTASCDNVFQHYSNKGLLFINIKLDGLLAIDSDMILRVDFRDIVREHIIDRFQLHFESKQCMDINDVPINIFDKGLSIELINSYKNYCIKQSDKLYGNKFHYWLRWFCVCDIDDVLNKVTFSEIGDNANKYVYDISECDFLITYYKEDYDWEYSVNERIVKQCNNKNNTLIIRNPSTNKVTYLSHDYRVLFPGKWWDCCAKFNDGIAIVSNYNNNNYDDKMSTYINTDGEYLFPGKWWKNVWKFRDGIAIVSNADGENTYINDKGEYLFPDKWWRDCSNFNDGIALVVNTNCERTYINLQGEYLFPGKWWEMCGSFSEGKAAILDKGKGWTYINLQGEYIFGNKYWEIAKHFSDGKASVYNSQLPGFTYINDRGEYLFPDKYWKNVSPFQDNKAIVIIDNNKHTFINDKGEYLFPGKSWNDCVITANNKLQVKQGDKYYFIDENTGEIIN